MAGDTGIGNRVRMCRAGNDLAIGIAIDALQHVGLWPFVWTIMRASWRAGYVRRRILTAVMALHAQAAFTCVGDDSTIHERHRGQGTDDVWIGRIGAG